MDKIIAGWSIQTEGDMQKIVFDTNDKKLFDAVLMVCKLAVDYALAANEAMAARETAQAAIADLKDAEADSGNCLHCKHCSPLEAGGYCCGECGECKEDCACRECRAKDKWEWRGAETAAAEKRDA